MSFILIRRTNYPLEGEGTSFYHQGKLIKHPDWKEVSKRWHLGPKPGGKFWFLYPNRWVRHPEAKWVTLYVFKETFEQYEIYVRDFMQGEVTTTSKGWKLLSPAEYTSEEVKRGMRQPEFYLLEK